MELYLILGGALGAALRKVGEWAALPDLVTIKGAVLEVIVGGAGVMLLMKAGLLPEKLTTIMDTPLSTIIGAGVLTYLPLDLMRRVQDYIAPAPPVTAVQRGLTKKQRRGLDAWR